jgi:hypothetical protein
VDDWLERYRKLWEERFDRLDDYLRELQAQGDGPKSEDTKGRNKDRKPKEKKRGRKK